MFPVKGHMNWRNKWSQRTGTSYSNTEVIQGLSNEVIQGLSNAH
jgi:hypothetical protein